MASIVVVGASDTGRAPLIAALLRSMLEQRHVPLEVESAGVIGHDGDEMQANAVLTLQHLGHVSPQHLATSLSDEQAVGAGLLLTVDRGTAHVLVGRYPQLLEKIIALSELANERDVPDLFHMSLDAWVVYGRTLQKQLQAALPAIISRIGLDPQEAHTLSPSAGASMVAPAGEVALQQPIEGGGREERLARLRRLLSAMVVAPEIIDWQLARAALGEVLAALGAGAAAGDMTPAVAALLHGLLAQQTTLPTPGQLAWLSDTAAVLERPIDAQAMTQIAASAARWPSM